MVYNIFEACMIEWHERYAVWSVVFHIRSYALPRYFANYFKYNTL